MTKSERAPWQRRSLVAVLVLMIGGLMTLNAGVASAHNWGSWHWDKTGSHIQIQSQIYGNTQTQAEAARVDAWNKIGILYNYRVNYHTDVSVFDGNFGATGWAGLASIESSAWDWGCFGWCHITHAHARYNSYYGGSTNYIQGVYCQEVFHTYGFDHSDTGDCMGLGYFASGTDYYGPHNNTDFYNRYRFH
jgi:hypothetical protein